MNKLPMSAFVAIADGDEVVVEVTDLQIVKQLEGLGLRKRPSDNRLYVKAHGQASKAVIIDKLRNMGVCFSDGREWCPAEVFEFLRDQGMISGNFQRVSWIAPNEPKIVTV